MSPTDTPTTLQGSAAHTPGPWEIFHGAKQFPWHPGASVWSTRAGYIVAYTDFMTSEIAEANARLIAAAPDLLAALKAVVAIADRKTNEFDAARAAIAKAEGRS